MLDRRSFLGALAAVVPGLAALTRLRQPAKLPPPPTGWERILNTTITRYIRTETAQVLRGRKLMNMLRAKGRINVSGVTMQWRVSRHAR